MTRSRRRKLEPNSSDYTLIGRCGPAYLLRQRYSHRCMPRMADDASDVGALQEVVVTAQKRSREPAETCRSSVEVLDTKTIEQLDVTNLDDYVKYSPERLLRARPGQGGNGQPGSSHVYMRGVVSGGDGNHSGSQPSVGTYLDEQPVTTIDGTRRRAYLRRRAHRGARGPAGHPVRREFRVRHDPHHQQQAGSEPSSRPATTSTSTRSSTAAPAGRPRASSTCRCRRSRPSAWSAGTSTTPATSTTSPAPTRARASSTACAPSRPGAAQTGFNPVIRAVTSLPDAGRDRRRRDQQCRLRQEQLQHGRHQRRPRGAEARSRRQLDRDADLHGRRI